MTMATPITTVSTLIRELDEPAPGVRRLVLADPDNWTLPPFLPGAHIDLHLAPGLVRTYSLCNDSCDDGRYVVAVKLEPAGRGGSRFIHEKLQVGSAIGVSIPRGGMRPTEEGLNVFIAGGIGITPFISAIRDLERRGRSNYVLHWASMGEPALADMIRPAIEAGRVQLYDTRLVPPPDITAIVADCDASVRAFCCGPAGMLDAFEAAVAAWPEERKHLERFTAPRSEPVTDARPFTVELAKSKRHAVVRPEVGLLGTLEQMGAEVAVSCGGGVCGACRTRWLEGPPVHRDRVLSPDERQREVMVCVAGCAGDRLVLDL